MKIFFLHIFLVFFFFVGSKNISALDQKLLKQIETYLNQIDSISSEFIQSSSEGFQESGKILILKPGKLRIEYKKKINF